VSGQRHATAALPRERPGTHCIGGLKGPRTGLDGCRKSRPTGTRSSDHSESLYRLSSPGSHKIWVTVNWQPSDAHVAIQTGISNWINIAIYRNTDTIYTRRKTWYGNGVFCCTPLLATPRPSMLRTQTKLQQGHSDHALPCRITLSFSRTNDDSCSEAEVR
jgi:hypothetical protein